MDVPKISVIVPVYNSAKYLERCINSILAQSFKEFELLLVDDCSTDNSLEICNKFKAKDSRISVYAKKLNEGTAQARKTGVFNATGEYIIFFDNDDWVEPVMLEELYIKIKSGNFDMVCCDFYVYYVEENEKVYKKQYIGNKTNIELIWEIISWENFWEFLPVTWNKLVRTEIYKKIDFPKTVYSEDRAIMTRVLYYCDKIGYINKALYHWCRMPASASINNNNKKGIKNIIDDYISYTTILLFVIDNKINTDKFIDGIIEHIDRVSGLCSNNEKILNVYKESIKKIAEMKVKNILTEETLLNEQNDVKETIKILDKRNYKKQIRWVINCIRAIIPKSIKKKIKKWLKHGHGT